MNGMNSFKVKFVMEDLYGFKKGQIYTAFKPKSKLGKMDILGIIDDFGEEYAYPASWFEIVDDETTP